MHNIVFFFSSSTFHKSKAARVFVQGMPPWRFRSPLGAFRWRQGRGNPGFGLVVWCVCVALAQARIQSRCLVGGGDAMAGGGDGMASLTT